MTTTDVERIKNAIGYDPILVSGHTDGNTWGGLTYRTVDDRDELVKRILPVLADVRDETRKHVAKALFDLEQEVQRLITDKPTDARLNGALGALQHARDIAEGVGTL